MPEVLPYISTRRVPNQNAKAKFLIREWIRATNRRNLHRTLTRKCSEMERGTIPNLVKLRYFIRLAHYSPSGT